MASVWERIRQMDEQGGLSVDELDTLAHVGPPPMAYSPELGAVSDQDIQRMLPKIQAMGSKVGVDLEGQLYHESQPLPAEKPNTWEGVKRKYKIVTERQPDPRSPTGFSTSIKQVFDE